MNDGSGPFEPFAVVVNDDFTQLSILSGLVRKAGLEPCAFTSAEAALADMSARAGTCLPALVVTDIYMPGIDGWRFCRLLRSPGYAILNQIPILVVSAIFAGEAPDRIAADLGAEAFFTCPVDGRRFVEKVRGILQGDRRRIPPRVLIVEENRTRADALRKAFEDRGYRADAVLTTREAAEAFDRIAYDVAVLNYPLSDGAGDDLLDVFNAQRPDCVFLMTTASEGPEQALDWMKRGAAACLYKPFEPEYLIDLCTRTRRERSLLRVQDLLETRTRELRESEERYRRLSEDMPSFISVFLPDGTLTYVNAALAKWRAASPADLIGKKFFDFLIPDDRETVRARLDAVKPEKPTETHVERCPMPDGSMAWLEWTNRAFFDETGRITYFQATGTDITKRKLMEEALKESEEKYRNFFITSCDAVFITTHDGRWIDCNDSAVKLFGYDSIEELSGVPVPQLYVDAEERRTLLALLQRHGFVKEHPVKLKRKNGAFFDALVTISCLPNADGAARECTGTIRDITDRRQAEEALRKSEQLLNAAQRQARIGGWEWDVATQTMTWTDERYRILDLAPEKFVPGSAELFAASLTCYAPEDRPTVLKAFQRCMEQGQPYDLELPLTTPKGRRLWIRTAAEAVQADGRVIRVVGNIMDITERKRSEEALRKSEERYRNIFNNAVEGIYQATLEGRYRIVNQAFARMHGYDSPEEMTAAVTDIGKQLYVDPEQRKRLIALLSASEEKTIRNYELRLRRKDGSMLWVSLNARLVRYSDEEDGLCIEGTCMDITQRKQAEDALVYRLACEHCTAECIGILAESGDIRDRLVRILEKLRSVANIGRAYIFENEYDADAGLCMTQIAESCAKGVKSHFGNPNSRRLPYNDNFSSLLSALQSRKLYAGIVSDLSVAEREILEPQGIVSILILPVFAGNALWGFIGFDDCEAPRQWRREDIRILATVADAAGAAILRHQAIEALRESEERHRTLVNGLPDFVIRYGRDGRHLFVSENVCRLAGIEADQYIGRTRRELGFPEAHCQFLEEHIRQVFDTGTPLETEFTFEGEQEPMLFNWRLLPEFDAQGAVKSLLSISRDITEHRRMEYEYRILFREMLDGFALQDVIRDEAGNPVDYRFRALNPAFERMIGLRAADIAGRTVLEVLPDIDRSWIDTFGKVALTGEPAFFERFSKIMGKHVETTVFRPAPDQIAVISVDVTERKQAEEALRQFKTVFDAANFGMAISDLNGVLIYINDCFARAHGHEAGDLVGQPLMRLHNEEQREQVEGLIRRIVSENVFDAQEVWHCRRDGTPFPMLMTGTLIRDDDGTPKYFAATAIDLAERKNLEAQLAQAQKMESVGRLAGGVAHDFNNMLSVILGYADMALNRADTTHPLYHALTQIRNSAVRSADLTRQLLAFARRQTIAPRALDINETVEGMLKMIQRLIGEDIDLAWRPKPEVWPVLMDPSQLDQILANLCVNARDAIAGVGKITIETENIVLDEAYCADHEGFVPGNFVMIAVSDDGQGMDRKTMSHLFEPFFTTKKAGKGTGLGLSTIYGAVKQNKGFINVYSEPGKGSTFKIYLPRHAGEKGRKQTEEAEIPTLKGQETILLVEDEPMILELAATILETQDYTVLQASTPGEAIRLAREHAGKIHLLLTDVIMPEMNGRELAKNLLSLYPDMKRLFMSGYTADVIAHHGVLDEGVRFISKPFSMKGLIAKVRAALDDGKEEKSCGPADGNRLNQRNSAHK